MMNWLSVINLFVIVSIGNSLVTSVPSIRGKIDLAPKNLTIHDISRINLSLYQINENYTVGTDELYFASAGVENIGGDFIFENLPLIKGINESTYFVLSSSSLDYNLKPNRILFKFTTLYENSTQYNVTAYQNIFGKEFFASPEITYPESLVETKLDEATGITISYLNQAPMRLYYQNRKPSFWKSGLIGNILNSRWKTAAVITVLFLALFPLVAEKLDPETTKLIKEEALRKQKEKYQQNNS